MKGSPIDVNIIQVYAPTTDHDEDMIESFYQKLEEVRKQTKEHEITIIMGDLNAKVGEGGDGDVVGGFGLGEQNERGDRLVEWCGRWRQVILNSWYRQHPRYLWTWRSPGHRYRNQIDYITINKRFRNAVTKVKTFPGADCGGNCDHVPVVAEVKLKLKRFKKAKKTLRKDWKGLKTENRKNDEFQLKLRNKYAALEEELDGNLNENTEWDLFTESLTKTTEELVPNEKRRGRQRWMTEEILTKMEERRKCKITNRERYNLLNRKIKQECHTLKERWLNEKCLQAEQ